ncbi:hypothetical protein CERSUDRAFT_69969 [Gelatoporia subvermispora B]|uniref:Protein kinase domain-containing protein n=1 Tax=Ceriporiopsis subvermispora (strain B) TaxID=914234 RepID=M2RR88_CERS8|nr:hypothetical protein CERSUDRAFT_69969 [Gelatoporia subvermispora B]
MTIEYLGAPVNRSSRQLLPQVQASPEHTEIDSLESHHYRHMFSPTIHLIDTPSLDCVLWDIIKDAQVMSPKTPRMKLGTALSTISEASEASRESGSKVLSVYDLDFVRGLSVDEEALCGMGRSFVTRRKGDSELFTVKIVRRSGSSSPLSVSCKGVPEDQVRAEQAALKALTEERVPFVIQLQRSFQDQQAFYLITLDYCHGGTLASRVAELGPMSSEHALFYTAEIVEGIRGIHALGIIHRAIEPANVHICADGHVMISGFASAYSTAFKSPRKLASGITAYQAPELVLGWSQDFSLDWWGFGLTLGFLLTGKNPFEDEADGLDSGALLKCKILHRSVSARTFGQVDQTALDLILRCIERNAASRLKAACIKRHPYFVDVSGRAFRDWDQVKAKKAQAPFAPEINGSKQESDIQDQAEAVNILEEQIPDSAVDLTWDKPAAADKFSFTRECADTDSINVQPLQPPVSEHEIPSSPKSVRIVPTVARIKKAASVHEDLEDHLSIPEEFGGLGRDSPKATFKSGALRKYSSLNFDDSDTLDSAPSLPRDDSSGAFSSPLSFFRKSHSHQTSPLSDDQRSPELPRQCNKLRKKLRWESAPSASAAPRLNLPPGIEQIGHGIGYTRRSEPAHARLALSLPTLTPRTCHALFTKHPGGPGDKSADGSRNQDLGLHKQERYGSRAHHQARSDGIYSGDLATAMRTSGEGEDPLDEVLQEIYGDPSWMSAFELSSAGSDPRAYVAWNRAGAGLGLAPSDVLRPKHVAAPAELATRSTLRLVPSSATRLDSEF